MRYKIIIQVYIEIKRGKKGNSERKVWFLTRVKHNFKQLYTFIFVVTCHVISIMIINGLGYCIGVCIRGKKMS